jgi:hypothetical protein
MTKRNVKTTGLINIDPFIQQFYHAAIFFAALGLILVFFSIFFFYRGAVPWDPSAPIDENKVGNFGDFFGGTVGVLCGFASISLLFITYHLQKKELEETRREFEEANRIARLQQFESKFFELLRIHRDNIEKMESKGKIGRSVVIAIKDEFKSAYDIVCANLKGKVSRPEDLVNIAYHIVYFGVGNSTEPHLKLQLQNIVKDEGLTILLINFFSKKREISQNNDKWCIYDGHQSRLGHYYRHLYLSLTYVDNQPGSFLSDKEKKLYGKMLRAQLSNHEQALLFINSLSSMGEAWKRPANGSNDSLMEKYKFIKNIPIQGFTYDLNPKEFYPKINFELEINEKRRKKEI